MNTYPLFMSQFFTGGAPASNVSLWIFVALVAWSLAWKGIALWKAARNNQLYWFVAMMVINTVGILEIFYIYVFAKKMPEKGDSSSIMSK
jgi:methionyl-tRNA synthetase